VPREGGNALSVYFTGAYTNESLQANHLSDEITGRGVTAVPGVKNVYDWGIGVGGRIVRDRVWFYAANRWWGTSEYQPGSFYNKSTSPFTYPGSNSR
jgi:hypothetical protein